MFDSQNSSRMVSPSRFAGAPVTKWLLIINIAIFFLDIAGVGQESWGRLTPYGAFTLWETFGAAQVWRLLTFQFLHAGVGHLLANMLGIYMFGGIVERYLGTRRFSAYYLLCGMAGALFYSLLVYVGWLSTGVLVGASAGIFGILVALIVIAPDMKVMLLFPPIPMKMNTLGILVLGLGAFTVLRHGNNAGGEAGHLGGALLGFLLMKNPGLLNWADGAGQSVRRRRRRSDYQPKIRPRTTVSMDSSEVDRILDKVNESGIHALTESERETLRRISKKD